MPKYIPRPPRNGVTGLPPAMPPRQLGNPEVLPPTGADLAAQQSIPEYPGLELPKMLPQTIPGAPPQGGGSRLGAMAGGAGAAALWALLQGLQEKDSKAIAPDDAELGALQIPAIDEALGSTPDTSVMGGDYSPSSSVKKSLGQFKRRGSDAGSTSPVVPVPEIKEQPGASSEATPGEDPRVAERLKLRKSIQKEEGLPQDGEPAWRKYQRRLQR